MPVDVTSEIVIERPRDQLAAFAADPSRAPEWYANLANAFLELDRAPSVGGEGANRKDLARLKAVLQRT